MIIRTTFPTLQSSGPSFLVVGADRVFIRPLDFVPGYVVLDGEPARVLGGLLGNGGPAFPGPDNEHLWVTAQTGLNRMMVLVGLDGQPVGPSITSTDTFPASSDGTGQLVLTTTTGTYVETPAGRTLITTGTLVAIGPTRWLTIEREGGACEFVVTDRPRATRRVLQVVPCAVNTYFPGVVSPDGRTGAFVRDVPNGEEALHVIDLVSGADHVLAGKPMAADGSSGRLVWSPDSKTLWFVTRDFQIGIVDRDGSHFRRLGLDLPPVAQLAFRIIRG